jgi:hypothetical protein
MQNKIAIWFKLVLIRVGDTIFLQCLHDNIEKDPTIWLKSHLSLAFLTDDVECMEDLKKITLQVSCKLPYVMNIYWYDKYRLWSFSTNQISYCKQSSIVLNYNTFVMWIYGPFFKGLLGWLSYGSWIYNYLCNQCLSPLTLWVQIPLRWGVLDTTLCDKVCQWFV